MADQTDSSQPATPWGKGKLVGQKPPLRLQEIWSLRTRLQVAGRTRALAAWIAEAKVRPGHYLFPGRHPAVYRSTRPHALSVKGWVEAQGGHPLSATSLSRLRTGSAQTTLTFRVRRAERFVVLSRGLVGTIARGAHSRRSPMRSGRPCWDP
jgi:hypothetical protein